jgi:hypothetical protein
MPNFDQNYDIVDSEVQKVGYATTCVSVMGWLENKVKKTRNKDNL